MTVPNNVLVNVQTYQKAELAYLLNSCAALFLSNKKYNGFEKLTGNLGDAVTFDLAPRYTSADGLIVNNYQPSAQRPQSLICSQAAYTATSYTAQQFLFNVDDYMDRFGMSAIMELGQKVENDIMKSVDSTLRVSNSQASNFGQLIPNTGPFRFFGDGQTAINSYNQLAQALANFRNFGASKVKTRFMLPDYVVPSIIGSGLNQFATKRNDEIANSWELGSFSNCDFYESNLLPIHYSGTIGDAGYPNNIMTLVSTNDPTGVNVTQITFTEPTSSTSVDAIKAGDLIQGIDPTFRFLKFIGHTVSAQPVQFVATADAASTAGTVTVSVRTATDIGLVSVASQNQNINKALTAGMQFAVMPSHQTGLIWSGDQWFTAMPKLPDYEPYPGRSEMDEETGASIRHYWGNVFGQNQQAYVRDTIWASTLVPETCMRVLFPLPN